MTARIPAGVAAGHPATATVGISILQRGGSAADAVAAMVLAGSVSETIFTGLAGGGFATHYDATTRDVVCHDFFVAVPGLDGTVPGQGQGIEVSFGGVAVPYDVGGPTVAVPGTPRGVASLHAEHGRLDWSDIVVPARDLAAVGAPFPDSHAELLTDVAAAMMLDAGIEAYSTDSGDGTRTLLGAQGLLRHAGLADTLELYREQGADALMTGEFGGRFVDAVRLAGGALSLTDMDAYRVRSWTARQIAFGPATVHLRGNDLDDLTGTFARYQELGGGQSAADETDRALNLVRALAGPARRSDTTSVVAVDPQGNACAATHSLGLGSGIWVGGVHGNSMLGEGELIRGEFVAGERMGSMMSPLVATDADGNLLLAGGAAGGSRIRPALLQVLSGILIEGLDAQQAVDRHRLSVAGRSVHLEPGFDPGVAAALTADGWTPVPWAQQKPYFGGAAVAAASGFAGDRRRGGIGVTLG